MINKIQYPRPRFNPPVQKDFSGIKSQVVRLPNISDAVRISSLGGFGDVTQNMFVYEFAQMVIFQNHKLL